MTAERVAVIGSGVSGLVAAHAITKAGGLVTLYEADARAGGHADTTSVVEGQHRLCIDTGFIVHNRATYPVLCRLFDELGVQTQESEMSMSIADDATGLEWAGARGVAGVLPSWHHLVDRHYLRMLREIPRFHRAARVLLEGDSEETLRAFAERIGLNAYFIRYFLEPLVAAVWSCDPDIAGEYPARYLFAFLHNHGMLSIFGSPTWRTVVGGSREYVGRVLDEIHEVRLGIAVDSIYEHDSGVEVIGRDLDQRTFDRVVVAAHPAEALALLVSPTLAQKEVLSAFDYSKNRAILHTDVSLMPRSPRTWASWNFRRPASGSPKVRVTYDLTRLQRLPTSNRYLVTLGAEELIDPATVIAVRDYDHPIYTSASVGAQQRLPEISSDRIAFAGAYHGWGFHEDGARSGLAAAERLGFRWPEADPSPARRVYRTRVTHVRRQPWRRTFTHTSYLWVVDLEAESRRPTSRLGRFFTGEIAARDHLGDPEESLRTNLKAFLATNGVQLGDASITLAAHPRAFGYCFNPISVWWCTRTDGTPLATVVEVHNTYGDRHAYLLHPDHDGRSQIAKAMYVSPFMKVEGTYEVRVPYPGQTLDIAISLRTEEGAGFAASCRGTRIEGHRLKVALAGAIDSLRIRGHGVRIWARRLPVQPRPTHHQEAVR